MTDYDIVLGFQAGLHDILEEDKSLLDELEWWSVENGLSHPADAAYQLGARAAEAMLAPIRWRRAVGEVLDTNAVTQLCGVSRQAVFKWVAKHQVLALPGIRTRHYPAWQFDPERHGVRPVVSRILQRWYEAEPEVSPLAIATWATAPTELLDGDTPAERLVKGEDDLVERVATVTIGERTR